MTRAVAEVVSEIREVSKSLRPRGERRRSEGKFIASDVSGPNEECILRYMYVYI